MTDLLWMPAWKDPSLPNPNYLQRFEGRVRKALDDWIALDRTAFYAEGGGQPSDTGRLTWDGGEARVTHVSKKGVVRHVLEGDLPPAGAEVRGEIDWETRLAHMRYHTSQHLLSGVMWSMLEAPTAGNQIRSDHARVDFEVDRLGTSDLADVEARVNEILARDLPVLVYEEDRHVLESRTADRALLALVPQSVKRLRVVQIGLDDAVADVCPCAGTHVARTREIGRFEITGRESKGEGRDRITYVLA